MKESDPPFRDRYYEEVAIRLRKAGFFPRHQLEGLLPVDWNGSRLCRLTEGGGAQFRQDWVDRDGGRKALDQAVDIASVTHEYMKLMEAAPVLAAEGLEEKFKLLAEFNGIVLAARASPQGFGCMFATWTRTYDRKGVTIGHYTPDYLSAKRDFTVRAGLVPPEALFSPEELAEVYRSVAETLEDRYPITREREKLLREVSEKIESGVPHLAGLVERSNRLELELQQNMEEMTL